MNFGHNTWETTWTHPLCFWRSPNGSTLQLSAENSRRSPDTSERPYRRRWNSRCPARSLKSWVLLWWVLRLPCPSCMMFRLQRNCHLPGRIWKVLVAPPIFGTGWGQLDDVGRVAFSIFFLLPSHERQLFFRRRPPVFSRPSRPEVGHQLQVSWGTGEIHGTVDAGKWLQERGTVRARANVNQAPKLCLTVWLSVTVRDFSRYSRWLVTGSVAESHFLLPVSWKWKQPFSKTTSCIENGFWFFQVSLPN